MNYNPDDLRKLQEIELEILKAVDNLCQKESITYFLDSGTALGAIRHKGFIPWDDDIDIAMLRGDYERFLKVAKNGLPDWLELCVPGENPHYAPMFSKVIKKDSVFQTKETKNSGFKQGIFLDVFVYDALPDNDAIAKKQISKCHRWQKMSYLYHSKDVGLPHSGILGAIEKISCFAAHCFLKIFFTPKKLVAGFNRAVGDAPILYGNECHAEKFMTLCTPVESFFPGETLTPTIMNKFEDGSFPVPKMPEEYLEICFGKNWNELPPIKDRKNHAPLILKFGNTKAD